MSTNLDTRATSDSTLARKTLRTVIVLVGACVVFVGLLSVMAVAVTSRAVGGGSTEARSSDPAPSAAKKPLSI